MKKLSILHVGNHTIPCTGGMEQAIWQSAREQKKLGHDVRVLVFDTCTRGEKLPARETKEGVEIHRIPQKGGFSFYRMPDKNTLFSHTQNVDIVNAHGFGPWVDLLAFPRKKISAKIVVTTHGGFFHTKERGLFKSIYRHLVFPFTKGIDGLIYVSENDGALFSPNPFRSAVIPNGIEEEYFTRAAGKKEKNTFLFVGRLSSNKRVDLLIETFALMQKKYPSARLIILGEDWEGLQKGLEEKVKENGLQGKVSFLGAVSQEEKRKALARADVFVSASEHEGFGISTIEGMALGCIPCLSSIPTFKEFAKNGRGFTADYSSPSTAAREWEKILEMKSSEKEALRKRVRAYAKSFSWKDVARKQVEWYTSILNGGKKS